MFAVEFTHNRAPVLGVCAAGQARAAQAQREAEVVQELAAKQAGEDFGGQQEAMTGISPLALVVQATGGDQAVDVRVLRQVTPPGVQGHEDAWECAQELGVSAEFKQALASAVKQQAVDPSAVKAPQG